MESTHFNATALPTHDGYSWTLTTRLGAILHEIEQKYGDRDLSWTILGVEFGPGSPQIWFPGNRKQVAVQRAANALNNTGIACYQLAHECVHLLAPSGNGSAPVLEEGLATMFSEDHVNREFGLTGLTNDARYTAAASAVRDLYKLAPDAIQKLRNVEPAFRCMTPDTFIRANLAVPRQLVDTLLSPFYGQ